MKKSKESLVLSSIRLSLACEELFKRAKVVGLWLATSERLRIEEQVGYRAAKQSSTCSHKVKTLILISRCGCSICHRTKNSTRPTKQKTRQRQPRDRSASPQS